MNMAKIISCNLLRRTFFIQLIITLLFVSCKKFLDAGDPPDRVTAEYVYAHNSSAIAVLNGIYYDLQTDGGIGQGRSGIAFNVGLSADEFEVPDNSLYKGLHSNDEFPEFWGQIYGIIFRANSAIEGLNGASSLKPLVKQQLLGEALFVRAFCYFYLVNLYGDVPLLTGTDYKVNSNLARASKEIIYEQIIADLIASKKHLVDRFVGSNLESIVEERVRPTKWAACALLARVYLYNERWSDAEKEATEVINQKGVFEIVPLGDVFLKNSKEAIWQMQQISSDGAYLHVRDADLYIFRNGAPDGFDNPVSVSKFLIDKFESADKRITDWLKIDSSTGLKYWQFFKYKVNNIDDEVNEYLMVFRLAEQYLIRAEARGQQDDLTNALADLNIIRERAGLSKASNFNKSVLLDSVYVERQLELFTEWGHRWFDLKRLGKIDDVMMVVCPEKGGTWAPYKRVYPIPISEFQYNRNLKQNDGYPSL